MSYEIYKKRLNRYGLDYQSRLQAERENNFSLYLLKSVYRVNFVYNLLSYAGTLEPRKQDQSETTANLLVPCDVKIDPGAVIMITDYKNDTNYWMVFYLEHLQASGYNKYIVLKMSHKIAWDAQDGKKYESFCYLYGAQNKGMIDSVFTNKQITVYAADDNLKYMIMPVNHKLRKGDTFDIDETDFVETYRITGIDLQSTEGIMYVTVDPTFQRDKSSIPIKQKETDKEEDFFWLNGGIK